MNEVIFNLTDQQLRDLKNVLQRSRTETQKELHCEEIHEPSNYKWKQRAQLEFESLNAIYKQI